MKKILWIIVLLFVLVGCGSPEREARKVAEGYMDAVKKAKSFINSTPAKDSSMYLIMSF